jgi:hypothetical protein
MTIENEDVLQKLAPFIVEIISDREGEDSSTLGTGFVVTYDGLVVTCRHVVTESDDKLMSTVKARFYSDFNKATSDNRGVNIDTIPKYTVTLVRDYTDQSRVDLAFFRLDLNLFLEKNMKLRPIELEDKVVSMNEFVTIDFRKAYQFSGSMAEGSVWVYLQT